MNLQEFNLNSISDEKQILQTFDWDESMAKIISSIENKIRIFEDNKPKLFPSDDCELAKILQNHERLKKATILDLRELQIEFEKKLTMAKMQYERDVAFAEKLHAEKINQLNDTHDAELQDAVAEYKDEIDYLQKQLDELSAQRKRVKFQKMKTFFFRQMREAKKKVHQLNAERVQMKNQISNLKRDLYEAKVKIKNWQNGQIGQHCPKVANCQIVHNGQNGEIGQYGPLGKNGKTGQNGQNTIFAQNFKNGQNFAFGQNGGDYANNNFTSKQITKVEIQFISETKKDEGPKCDTNYLINRSREIKKKLDTLDDAGYTDQIITEIVNEYSRIEMVLNNFKQYSEGFIKETKFFDK